MKLSCIILLLYLFFLPFACTKSPDIPEAFQGSYFEPDGTAFWICSIFPDFLVYENEFWSYKTKSVNEDDIKFVLTSSSGEKQELSIIKQDSLFLVSGLNREYSCIKNGSDIQINPGNEAPVWEAGTAVIKGVVYDDTTQNLQVKIEAEKYFTTRDSEVRVVEVNELGQFSISIPVLNSQSVLLFVGDHRWRRIFVTPGDSLTVLINGQNGRPVHFMGPNADVCYHIENVLDTLYQLGEVYSFKWNLEPEAFRQYADSLSRVQLEYMDRYVRKRNCSELFYNWGKRFVECLRVVYLGSYSYKSTLYGMGNSQRLDIDHPYYTFINTIDFNDNLLLLEAITGSIMVGELSNYYNKVMSEELDSPSRIHKDWYHLLAEHYQELSPSDSSFVASLRDSLALYSVFSQRLISEILNISDPFREEVEYKLLKVRMDRRIDFFLAQDYTLMRDVMLMKTYADIKLARKFKVLEYVYNRVYPLIHSKKLQDDLAQDYNRFSKMIEELHSIDMHANQSQLPGEDLLLELINSNKDSLLILDFWYTACGPCRGDFKRMKSIKTQLYDLPIKFIYMCYSSSEEDWQNVVSEFEVAGDHYLLSGSQFSYFSNIFQLSSAPRYVLINREGVIANDNFPRPATYEQYRRELNRYIDR